MQSTSAPTPGAPAPWAPQAAVLGTLAIVQVLLGFAFQWFLMTAVGPGLETDALFAALVVPQLILQVVAGALTHVLTPLLSVHEPAERRRQGWSFVQGVALLLLLGGGLLALSAPVWLPWTVPGFPAWAQALAVDLVRIQLLGMLLTGLASVLRSVCHAWGRFALAEFGPVLGLTAALAFVVWMLPQTGVRAAAWGTALGAGVHVLALAPALGAYRRPDWGGAATREAARRMRPLALGYLYLKSEDLVDRLLASMAPAGGLSLLHLAQQIYDAGSGVLHKSVTAPLVPRLARAAAAGEWRAFHRDNRRWLLTMLALTLTALVGLIWIGQPLLALVFARGRFGAGNTEQLWWLLLALGGVWIGGAVGGILSSSFYAQGNTRTPVQVAVVGFTVAIGLKVGGFQLWGVMGIAVATSLYYLLNCLTLFALLVRAGKRLLHEAAADDAGPRGGKSPGNRI